MATFLIRTSLLAQHSLPSLSLSGSASVRDQYGDQVTLNVEDPASTKSGGGSHLVQASKQMVGDKAVYTVNLVGTLDAFAANDHSYSGGAAGYAKLDAGVKPISIHLTAPNPAVHPEIGNDSHRQDNQFVYGDYPASCAHDQDGNVVSDANNLCLPITVTANGADAPTMQWLKDHTTITVTPAIPNAVPFDLVISGSRITLQSRYTEFNLYYDGFGNLITYNGFLARGLPKSNSDFGNHQVTLTVDGQVVDAANTQTFFNATDSTHPVDLTGPTSGLELPNWFYYYGQVYPATGTYVPTPFNFTYPIPPFQTVIGTTTIDNQDQPVFDLGENCGPGQLARPIGIFNLTGIFSYIHVCSHEQGHRTVLQTGGIISPTMNPLETCDGDSVVDLWEQAHHLSPCSDNTTGYYTTEEPGDNEFLADIQALPSVLNSKKLWIYDWADVGVQYGYNQLNPLPVNPNDYTFVFSPTANGLFFVKDGYDYRVKTIQDLLTEFPNLVTGFSDLDKP